MALYHLSKQYDQNNSNLEFSSASICIKYSCDAAKENVIHMIYNLHSGSQSDFVYIANGYSKIMCLAKFPLSFTGVAVSFF